MSNSIDVLDGGLKTAGKLLCSSATIASASTITLGDGNFNIISGTTTIDAIAVDVWEPGSEVTLLFQGSLTVKHATAGAAGSAEFFLSGSVDLSAAANTVLKIVYDGTYWQEVSRKVA
jgi:hypothetical protein